MLRILDELSIIDVWERGVPNRERIAIKAVNEVDLSNYLLFLGLPLADQLVFPLNEHLFWFGKEIVVPPTWVIVYTGPGERKITTMKHTGEPALVLHWGKKHTVLNDPDVAPVVVGLEGVLVGPRRSYLSLPQK